MLSAIGVVFGGIGGVALLCGALVEQSRRLLVGGIACLLVAGASAWGLLGCDPTCELDYSTELVAFRTGQTLEGSFFLASGHIGTEHVLRYIWRRADGAMGLASVPAARSTIYEDDSTPRLECHSPTRLSSWFHAPCHPTYRFFIPPGSVVRGYTLSLGDIE